VAVLLLVFIWFGLLVEVGMCFLGGFVWAVGGVCVLFFVAWGLWLAVWGVCGCGCL